jgi:endonuclease YncB( thermonuclease family)
MRRNPGRVIALLFAIALWLSYGAAAERWPAIDIAHGLGSTYLFGHAGSVDHGASYNSRDVRWRAVDGDTLEALGHGQIRVIGVDTPELHPCRCPFECELGKRAKHRTQALLDSGRVFIEPAGPDRYGRTLAHVEVNGRDLGTVLIAEGLGRRYSGGHRRSWCS